MSFLVATGELLALVVLVMGVGGFCHFYLRTRSRFHLAMLPSVVLVVGSTLILFSSYPGGWERVAIFMALQATALPFYVYWGERNRRKMEEIASTGRFDPGFLLPSENHVMISFFGQVFEDLAKPVAALGDVHRLNDLLGQVAANHPVLAHARFTERGEFRLDRGTILRLGRKRLDTRGFSELLNGLIDHFAHLGGLEGEPLKFALRGKWEATVTRYTDFLIDEGLLHVLARGLLTDTTPTGTKALDKALAGGLPQGSAVLLLGHADQETEALTQTFVRTGMLGGEGCIVVSATKPPSRIRQDIGLRAAYGESGDLRIVDCHTARIAEVPTMEVEGDTIISPVALPVVEVAVAKALESLGTMRRRAVVDILTPYLSVSSIEKTYPYIVEMVHRFRSSGCTAIFVFNLSAVEDQISGAVLEEIFDTVLRMKNEHVSQGRKGRALHGTVGDVLLSFEKLGLPTQSKSRPDREIRVQLEGFAAEGTGPTITDMAEVVV